MKHITVVAAVIEHKGKYLCVQRGINKYDYISKKWEFPGGKVEADESPENALIREIQEELAMEINELDFLITVKHSYPDFRLTMHTFLCKSEQTTPTLTEHLEYTWQSASNMNHLDWAAADLPIVEKLITLS
ncbi:MAG: (deoxy)nucleoside triphosphate pyrophosphohydrolase [Bacteroidia bacterium]|nr:(deoxy)nucleoside triphosphate pyrophosphohydrolase [Bacteroidia bacterium]